MLQYQPRVRIACAATYIFELDAKLLGNDAPDVSKDGIGILREYTLITHAFKLLPATVIQLTAASVIKASPRRGAREMVMGLLACEDSWIRLCR